MKVFASIVFASVFSTGAWAEREVPEFHQDVMSSVGDVVPELGVLQDGIYQIPEDVLVTPFFEWNSKNWDLNLTGETLSFGADEAVHIQTQEDGSYMVQLRLLEDEVGTFPAAIVLTKEELYKLNPTFLTLGDREALDKIESGYEKSEVAARGGGKKRRRMRYRGAGGCVAYVQKAIGWRGGRTGNGREVTRTLRRHGWGTVSCKSPPVGAVASWSGGSHGMGHTAIWNGRGWCYDLGCHDPGRKYRLIDCVARGKRKS